MKPMANTRRGVVRPFRRSKDVVVDELSLRGAVIGDGLMLRGRGGDGVSLHTITGGRAVLLGQVATAAEAWSALDELDAPATALEQAA